MGKSKKHKHEKLAMRTPNLADKNFAALTALFPNAVTETIDENGTVVRAIDADVLAQEINTHVVSGREERYQFSWPDKKRSMLLANAPIAAALRPWREESVDFDNTENVYIEGDNLDVLKLLRETYLNKVKMIYIDPPYNTGSDLVYADKWAVGSDEWLELSGNYDENGNRLVRNLDSNGRFHTDWLNMMYPRLRVARDLLSEDGVIFISIDDNEVENLRKICGEIFGETNFLAQVVWERAYAPINLKKHFSESHDYIVCYAKNSEHTVCNGLPREDEQNRDYRNVDNDPRGPWKPGNPSVGPAVEKNIYEIISPSGRKMFPPSGRSWLYSKVRFEELKEDNRIYWGSDGNSIWAPKMFLSEVKQGVTPMTIWKYEQVGHSQDATKRLKELFGGKAYFDYPKPVDLVKRCLLLYTDKDCIVFDFFSGSATTAHAVMQLNAEDGGKRRFIMVQLPEPCDEKSEAYKAGYKNVSEIGKERIRRAGRKVISEKWAVISQNKELLRKYGCKELPRTDCLAEGDGLDGNALNADKKAAAGGALRAVGSDEAGSNINSLEHSRRAGEKPNKGVYSVSGNSPGIKGKAGDTVASLHEGGVPCRYGYFGSDEAIAGNRENVECPYKNTEHCPLITNHFPDVGFRVFKLDSSNMKKVYYTPEKYAQMNFEIEGFMDNIEPDRSEEDLLFQVMLDLGIPLSARITRQNGAFNVNDNYLIAFFGRVDTEIITEIARQKPYYAVFRDSSFSSDSALVNFEQIFSTYSPQTIRRVL